MIHDHKVYCSGSIGCDKDFKLIEGGVGPQTTALLENLSKVLKAAGSSLDHILKVNIYLADMKNDFGTMNEAYVKVCISASA